MKLFFNYLFCIIICICIIAEHDEAVRNGQDKERSRLKCAEPLNIEELTFPLRVSGASYSHNPPGHRHANAESPVDIFLSAARPPETLPPLPLPLSSPLLLLPPGNESWTSECFPLHVEHFLSQLNLDNLSDMAKR